MKFTAGQLASGPKPPPPPLSLPPPLPMSPPTSPTVGAQPTAARVRQSTELTVARRVIAWLLVGCRPLQQPPRHRFRLPRREDPRLCSLGTVDPGMAAPPGVSPHQLMVTVPLPVCVPCVCVTSVADA